MITDLLISIIVGFIDTLLSLLPTIDIPSPENLTSGVSYVNALSEVLPIRDLVKALLLGLTVSVLLYSWDAIVWLYHQFWGSG